MSKASAGAMEVMDIFSTSNLSNLLNKSAEYGWTIYGTDINSKNKIIIDQDFKGCLLNGPTILVLGNEGQGLKQSISNQCDTHLVIASHQQPRGTAYNVDSLNVSVATGILINTILKA